MNRFAVMVAGFLFAMMSLGCSKPDSITRVNSPVGGVLYTIELFKAGGPTSDTTRVYVHFDRNGKHKKVLVLDGENLTVAKILWNGPHDATFCLDGGVTNTFRNQVTLIVGDTPEDSVTMFHHLRENCDSVPARSYGGPS